MKIAGLISRFENKGVVNEQKSPRSDLKTSYQKKGNHDQVDQSDLTSKEIRSSRNPSPGSFNVRQAAQNRRSIKIIASHEMKDEEDTVDLNHLGAECLKNDLMKASSPQRQRAYIDDAKTGSSDSTRDAETEDEENKREFLITEHSNRTLVVDNKKKKSQTSTLPDTPWSSRNLGGSSQRKFQSNERVQENRKRPKKADLNDHEAEYGTICLKDSDLKQSTEGDDSLPPEVIAMSAAGDKKNRTKSKSLPSLLKSYSIGENVKRKESGRKTRDLSSRQINGGNGDSDQHKRRNASPGFFKRRGSNEKSSNEKTETKQMEITVEPREDHDSELHRPPTRSFSAGNLALARRKAKGFRERTSRSQSPGEQKAEGRKIRPGRKKSEMASKIEEMESVSIGIRRTSDIVIGEEELLTVESSGQPRPPRRIRGRSPGSLLDKKDSKCSGEDDTDEASQRPTLRRLESRGRSPGAIQVCIDMSGEVSRSQSPGALDRNGANDRGARSPASLRRISYSGRVKSPGRLVSLNKSSGHSHENRSQSPSEMRTPSGRKTQGYFQRSGHGMKPHSPSPLTSNLPPSKSPRSSKELVGDPSFTPSRGVDIVVQPPSHFQSTARMGGPEATLPRRSSSPERVDKNEGELSQDDINKSAKNLCVPRAKSPGALARRPVKNPRVTQTQKAQSLFEKRTSSTLMSPRGEVSIDDASVDNKRIDY